MYSCVKHTYNSSLKNSDVFQLDKVIICSMSNEEKTEGALPALGSTSYFQSRQLCM